MFIVDDSEDVLDLFVLLAELNGFILETAKNGEEALVKLAQSEHQPSIVFVDWHLPGMNGAEFVGRAKADGLAASSQIVIFSAADKSAVPIADQALTWLAKPFNLIDVLNVINLSHAH